MKHNVNIKVDLFRKDKSGGFQVNNLPIDAKITFAGDRLNYFTGYRIDKDNFDPKPKNENMYAKKNTKGLEGKRVIQYNDINQRISIIKATLTTLFAPLKVAPEKALIISTLDQACRKSEPATTEAVNDPLIFLPMFKHYVNTSRLSKDRKKHAFSTINHWQRFADKKKLTLTFDIITPDTLRAFEKFLLSEKVDIKGSKEKKAARGLNTLHTIFAITRTFFNHARKELAKQGITIQYPFDVYKVPSEVYGTPIFLTLDERNKLFDKKIESERLAQVRDIFIFQCMTGARVGDMCRWTKSNISNNVLSYIARKTKEGHPVTVTVPLTAKAIEILSRYDMPDNRLLPFISDQKYNVYLKELFVLAELTRIITRQHPTTREPENVRLCDIASSHMARRTFVGNMFGKKDSAIIASMSGHVANSKAFARYYNVSEDLQRSAIEAIE
ncbi:MAG: phage integrase SAM-like domain-containing protein [Bacteroidales bacterium]|nr:phage integrase SAM-like domain-containing protein [Bacteroidales bacterium]